MQGIMVIDYWRNIFNERSLRSYAAGKARNEEALKRLRSFKKFINDDVPIEWEYALPLSRFFHEISLVRRAVQLKDYVEACACMHSALCCGDYHAANILEMYRYTFSRLEV